MAQYRVGVDIGASRVRAVLVSLGERPRLENSAVRELPAGISSSGLLSDPAAVGEALREAVDELGTRERRCVLTIGYDVARFYVGPFPARGNRRRRRAAATYVAREHFGELYDADPSAIGEAVFPHPTDPRQAVILAVRRDALASRVAAATAAGLRVDAVDHDVFALRRAFPNAGAVLDVGLDEARLYGFPPDLRYVVAISRWGGQAITDELALELVVGQGEAERRKRDMGSAAEVRQAFDHLREFLADAVNVDIRGAGADVRDIVLVGNGVRIAEIPALVHEATEFPAHVAMLDVESALPPGALARITPDIALAYGAALWGRDGEASFDYLRTSQHGLLTDLRDALADPQLRVSAIACAASVVMFFGTYTIQHVRLANAIADERIAAAKEEARKGDFDKVNGFIANVQRAAALRDDLRARRQSAGRMADTLATMENAMPPHVALKQMSDNGSGWTLVGRTRDLRYVATAVVGIDKIPGLSAEIGPVTPVDPPAVVAPARVDAAPGASPTPAPAPSPSSSPMVSFQIDVRRQTGVTP